MYSLDPDKGEWDKYGCWPNKETERVFGYVDNRPRPEAGYPEGEDSNGIVLRRHPQAILRDADQDIKQVVRMWRLGVRPKTYTLEEYKTLPSYVLDAFEICRQAQLREEYRRDQRRR